MAKSKTKECVMSTMATETRPGVWTFSTGRYLWEWSSGFGMNLSVKETDSDKPFQPSLYAKTLDHAVMFAHGFEGGYVVGSRKH